MNCIRGLSLPQEGNFDYKLFRKTSPSIAVLGINIATPKKVIYIYELQIAVLMMECNAEIIH